MTDMRFRGVIGSQDAGWLWPESRLLAGAWTRGVPIDIDVTTAGLTLASRTRLLRGERWSPVTLTWDELRGASARSRGHTGRTGGLTLQEMFEVTLEIVGPRAAGFQMPTGVSKLLPGFPSAADILDRTGCAPLVVTTPHGDDLAAVVSANASANYRP